MNEEGAGRTLLAHELAVQVVGGNVPWPEPGARSLVRVKRGSGMILQGLLGHQALRRCGEA